MIQTNIVGLTFLTRQILPQMAERKQGYIMNLGSIAGSYAYEGSNVYGATKAFCAPVQHEPARGIGG